LPPGSKPQIRFCERIIGATLLHTRKSKRTVQTRRTTAAVNRTQSRRFALAKRQNSARSVWIAAALAPRFSAHKSRNIRLDNLLSPAQPRIRDSGWAARLMA
jgi:hypothetical protein